LTDHNQRLDLTAKEIEALSEKAFDDLLERISNGEDPQPAIQAIMDDFEPAYREVLAAAFTQTLARAVGAAELRDYPIGEMTLSRRLYAEANATAPVVREIIRKHMAGFHDARTLSMQIYEGYSFKTRAGLPDDPLQWPRQSPKWPKYMREVINADPASFNTYMGIARRAAGNIKTPGYRAALNEALDALENGRGEKVLARKLEVAFQERMRYHANRIAQTELHRAYMDKQAEEIMADDSIQAVKVVMSSTHPRTDICDLFSKQDKYGLGPGLYPKEHAPRPPYHPHCRCVLHSKRLIKTDKARENLASERQYLARVMREDGVGKAAQIIGGRAKLAAALTNAPIDAIVNIHRPVPYRLGRVGDAANTISGMNSDAIAAFEAMPDADARRAVLMVLRDREFERFSKGDGPGVFPVAVANQVMRDSLGTSAKVVRLSSDDRDKQIRKDYESGRRRYELVQRMIDNGWIVKYRDDAVSLYQEDGEWFQAAIRVTKAKDEIYLVNGCRLDFMA
jgi:hypothetical protein